jgi:hypothetical protein
MTLQWWKIAPPCRPPPFEVVMRQPPDAYRPPQLKEFEGYYCPTGLRKKHCTFTNPAYVFVSGSHGNPWGHALLRIDPAVGYVHAALPGRDRALFLPSEEFHRYLAECGKVVWEVKSIQLQPAMVNAAYILTNKFLIKGFTWVPWHDCVTMVDEIARVGGSAYIANTVFPDKAVAALRQPKIPAAPAMAPPGFGSHLAAGFGFPVGFNHWQPGA